MIFRICSHVKAYIICGGQSVFGSWTEFGEVLFQMTGCLNVAQQHSDQFTSLTRFQD